MPAKDLFHDVVKEALIDDGWTITHDPFSLKFGDRRIEIDLGAEKLIAAEKDMVEIVVEVKSFVAKSMFYALHEALGQYNNYRRILKMANEDRILFLAVPEDAYDTLFTDAFGKLTIQEENLKIIVYRPTEKDIVAWIK